MREREEWGSIRSLKIVNNAKKLRFNAFHSRLRWITIESTTRCRMRLIRASLRSVRYSSHVQNAIHSLRVTRFPFESHTCCRRGVFAFLSRLYSTARFMRYSRVRARAAGVSINSNFRHRAVSTRRVCFRTVVGGARHEFLLICIVIVYLIIYFWSYEISKYWNVHVGEIEKKNKIKHVLCLNLHATLSSVKCTPQTRVTCRRHRDTRAHAV